MEPIFPAGFAHMEQAGGDGRETLGDIHTGVAVHTRPKARHPNMYRLLMLNDDYTPMEFVVHVLQRFFSIPEERAVEIMLQVHREGRALVGVFSHDIAETKVAQVTAFARKHQHPLRCALDCER